MGIGPVFAIPMVLQNAGLSIEDVDLYEVSLTIYQKIHAQSRHIQINEAFASQYAYCIRELGLNPEKVNVNGGAIAFGHPLDEYNSRVIFLIHHADSNCLDHVAPVRDKLSQD
jgi:acetyl-CoA acetyltransferase